MRRREYRTEKSCAPQCTVSCVQQVGILDNWRAPQNLKPLAAQPGLVNISSPSSSTQSR